MVEDELRLSSYFRHAAEYVRTISAQERSHVRTVIERMIETTRRAQELKQLNTDISAFYDALPDASVLEDRTWGQCHTRRV